MKYNPYSFSKIECWNSCPYKFKLNYLTDLERVPTENLALYRGSYFHHYIETRNKDFKINHIFTQEEKDACDKILKEFFNSDIYYHLENKGQHELKFSISTKLEFLPYKSKDGWLRGAIDYHYFKDNKLIIVDWKSGRYKTPEEQSNSQTMLYAIWGFLKYPEINEIEAYYVYIEHNLENKFLFKREELTSYIKKFFKNVKHIETDLEFKKRPTNLCNWCDFKNQGFCEGEMKIEITKPLGGW